MVRRFVRVVLLTGICALSVAIGGPASAACHAFVIAVSPTTVEEGGKVTVTVERDAAVNPSSVRVTSIDESARAPADYPKVDRRIEFSTGTTQAFELSTVNDSLPEGDETFRLHLSEPRGCQVNQNFSTGPDAEVRISASDAQPVDDPEPGTPAPPPSSPTRVDSAPARTASATTTPSATPATTATATPSPSVTFGPQAVTDPEDDGGLGAGAIAAIALGVLAAGSGAAIWWFRFRGV